MNAAPRRKAIRHAIHPDKMNAQTDAATVRQAAAIIMRLNSLFLSIK